MLPAFSLSSLQQSLGPGLPTEDEGKARCSGRGPLRRDRWDPRAEGVGRVGGDFQAPGEEEGAEDGSRRGSGTVQGGRGQSWGGGRDRGFRGEERARAEGRWGH